MKKNDIDIFFKSRSHSFNEIPSDDLWKKIEVNLAQEPKIKSNFKKTFLTMALPIITVIVVASLYFGNDSLEKTNKTIIINDTIKKEKTFDVSDSNSQLKPSAKTLDLQDTIPSTKVLLSKNNIFPKSNRSDIQKSETSNIQEKIYSMDEVRIKPEYPGNSNKLYLFIEKRFKTPKDCPSGRIRITFIVEKDGSLSNFEILKDIGYGTGTEAIRVLKESPKWEPGKQQDGKIVRVQYTLPITIKANENPIDYSPVYNMVGINVQPEFIGGKDKFYEFINQNYKTPKQCPKGKIYVTFIVEKDGALSNFKILRDLGFGSGEEAIRVLKECPKWEPGEQNGEKVRVLYSIPITVVP